MTPKQRKAMEQALEFMDELLPPTNEIDPRHLSDPTVLRDAQKRDALRAALAEQPKAEQEPYAWMAVGGTIWRHKTTEDDVPLYTTPQPAKRVPLTDEEITIATSAARDALLDHIYEYGTAAEGVLELVNKLARAAIKAYEAKQGK